MRLLSDEELWSRIDAGQLFTHVPDRTGNKFGPRSPVQPCSIDLHVGRIYVPGAKHDEPGGEQHPIERPYPLRPGETALVTTLETIEFTNDVAAISFPPAHLSGKGLLMTNPGHVDAGYHGKMRFTLINMSRETITLTPGEMEVVTVLVFQLDGNVRSGYLDRNPGSGRAGSLQSRLDVLSRDFLNFKNTARTIAKRAVAASEATTQKRHLKFQTIVSIVSTVAVIILAAFGAYSRAEIAELKHSQQLLTHKIDETTSIAHKLEGANWSDRLSKMEEQFRTLQPQARR